MTDVPIPTPTTTDESLEKMTIADSASLAFFTNPLYLNLLQRKKLCQQPDNTANIKFYRKRIVSLFKEMLKEPEGPDFTNKEIKEIHTMFVNASIRYFEVVDKKDIIQGQHTQSTDTTVSTTSELSTDDILELASIAEANDIMMRKNINVASLDNYVITKQDTSMNEIRIIPMKMEINLKTNDLKIKGVPPKKTIKIK
jgi:hypothetical protein